MANLQVEGKLPDKQLEAFEKRLEFNLKKCTGHQKDPKKPGYGAGLLPGFASTLNDDIVATVLNDVLSKPLNLEPGDALHVQRDKSRPLSRAYTISRNDNGEYLLFLEPKSKMDSGVKRIIQYASGTTKTRKVAVRIDTLEPIRYAALISKFDLSDESERKKMEQSEAEINVQNKLHKESPAVVNAIRGAKSEAVIDGKVITKICVFSELKDNVLSDVLGDKFNDIVKGTIEERVARKVDMIGQMLSIIKAVHAAGYTVNDIKPDNFLFDEKQHQLSLIDLGFAARLREEDGSQPDESTKGTIRYMSTWAISNILVNVAGQKTFSAARDLITAVYADDEDKAVQFLTSPALKLMEIAAIRDDKRDQIPAIEERVINDGKSDVWALGMTIYDLLYGQKNDPDKICEDWEKSKFFSAIFKISQTDAPDINKLISLFKENIKEIENIAKGLPAANDVSKKDTSPGAEDNPLVVDDLLNLEEYFKDSQESKIQQILKFKPKELPVGLKIPALKEDLPEILKKNDIASVSKIVGQLELQNNMINAWLNSTYGKDKIKGSHVAAQANMDCQKLIIANCALIYLCNTKIAEGKPLTIHKGAQNALTFDAPQVATHLMDEPSLKKSDMQKEIKTRLPEIITGSFLDLYGSKYKPNV